MRIMPIGQLFEEGLQHGGKEVDIHQECVVPLIRVYCNELNRNVRVLESFRQCVLLMQRK